MPERARVEKKTLVALWEDPGRGMRQICTGTGWENERRGGGWGVGGGDRGRGMAPIVTKGEGGQKKKGFGGEKWSPRKQRTSGGMWTPSTKGGKTSLGNQSKIMGKT